MPHLDTLAERRILDFAKVPHMNMALQMRTLSQPCERAHIHIILYYRAFQHRRQYCTTVPDLRIAQDGIRANRVPFADFRLPMNMRVRKNRCILADLYACIDICGGGVLHADAIQHVLLIDPLPQSSFLRCWQRRCLPSAGCRLPEPS